jgi:hypothetical protein
LWWVHVFGGGAGGLSALTVGQPFDTIKIRQQQALPTLLQCVKQEGFQAL